jgi:hypothetical protein
VYYPQKGNFAFDVLAFGILLGAREGVGIHDERSFFALADVSIQFGRLIECHPTR